MGSADQEFMRADWWVVLNVSFVHRALADLRSFFPRIRHEYLSMVTVSDSWKVGFLIDVGSHPAKLAIKVHLLIAARRVMKLFAVAL